MPSKKEDHLFFRLRIPKPLGDQIVDLAWQGRRSTNSQILLLLEKALDWKGPSLVVETPAGRGSKAAGANRTPYPPSYFDEGELEPEGVEPPEQEGRPQDVFSPITPDVLEAIQQAAAAAAATAAGEVLKVAMDRATAAQKKKPVAAPKGRRR